MTITEQPTDNASSLAPSKALIFSADDHILEHPEVWTARLSSTTWGDRIPRVEHDATTGTDTWVIDGRPFPLGEVAQIGALLPDRVASPAQWQDVPEAASTAQARLVAMDADGVTDSVLYPLVAGLAGQRFASIPDAAFERDCAAAYNDYVIDEWVSQSPRFVGQAIVPVGDVDTAVAEIVRSVERGHRGVIMPGNARLIRGDLPHINEEHWDPVWSAISELGVPVAFHSGSSSRIELPPYAGDSPAKAAALGALVRPVSSSILLSNLLFSGILVRFPSLKVVFAESTVAWVAFVLEGTEHSFRLEGRDRYGIEDSPAEQFRRQVYVTGWYDRTGFESRYHIGVENILWSTNFPQPTSNWPDSSAIFNSAAAGLPNDERADVLQNNARRLYRPKA
jgi:uncharacterized protein